MNHPHGIPAKRWVSGPVRRLLPVVCGLIGVVAMAQPGTPKRPVVVPVRTELSGEPAAMVGLPVGRFLTDSIEIGRPFQYALSFRHRSGEDVFFPDTNRHFAPFWVRAVALFPTRTQDVGTIDAVSLDSAVYTLVSFETASRQLLQVPIRMTNGPDSVVLLSTPDTVFLRSRLMDSGRPGALALVAETDVVPLRQQFNYPYLAIALLGIAVMLGVIYSLFNRPLRRQWRLLQLDQRHRRFTREFTRLKRDITTDTAADTANRAVVGWKTYLERLEREPYASLTSREIADRINDDALTDALREVDQMIYGGTFTERSIEALKVLRGVAVRRYQARRSELRQTAPIAVADPTLSVPDA